MHILSHIHLELVPCNTLFFCGKVPRLSSNQDDWDRFNMQLVASLKTHMDPMLQHHLDNVDKAEKAWEILKNKFRVLHPVTPVPDSTVIPATVTTSEIPRNQVLCSNSVIQLLTLNTIYSKVSPLFLFLLFIFVFIFGHYIAC